MAKEALFGLSDLGATNTRVVTLDVHGHAPRIDYLHTHPENYELTVEEIANSMLKRSRKRGHIQAVSLAVAAEMDESGVITLAGNLTPWVGRNIGKDMADALSISPDRVSLITDTEALAISQQQVNDANAMPVNGLALALSSGWGAAGYTEDGDVFRDGPGHIYLRDGAVCPCGASGHAEAFISGEGVLLNHGRKMKKWLKDPASARQLVTDISDATIALIERHRKDGFNPQELRWTGGVVVNQPFVMQQAYMSVRRQLGEDAPRFDTLSMGDKAGLHGAFIDAQRTAAA